MNRFVKKLLAKYVKYIEIIGYSLVFLFIAGLVALSTIKAEDEYVNLTGTFEISFFFIPSETRQFIIDVIAEPDSIVQPGDDLLRLTDHERFTADQSIRINLEAQIEKAREHSDFQLAGKLSPIVSDLKRKTYPDLKMRTITSPIQGVFILFHNEGEVVGEEDKMGGVFNFNEGMIRVTEFPADKRMKKKLKKDQTATVTLSAGPQESISLSAVLVEHKDQEVMFRLEKMSTDNMVKIAHFLSTQAEGSAIEVNISVLVGSRTWMNLIWS